MDSLHPRFRGASFSLQTIFSVKKEAKSKDRFSSQSFDESVSLAYTVIRKGLTQKGHFP